MSGHELLKQLLPPMLVTLLRDPRMFAKSRYTWQGIYTCRQEVPTENVGYDDEIEVKKHQAWTSAALDSVNAGKPPYLWHKALAIVAATTGAQTRTVRVLDVGGALGSGYVQLLGTLPENVTIQYAVVELPAMCAAGRQLFSKDTRITFHTSFPDLAAGAYDIVYARGVFPYVDDYRDLLQRLASVKATFILLAELAAGNIPTFATKQMNLTGKKLAYWLLNRDEVVGSLAEAGYEVVFDIPADHEYDQRNFPQTHRLGRMRDILFRRSGRELR